jgi:hypothetical protein
MAKRQKSRPARWAEAVSSAQAALEPLREAVADLKSIQEEYEEWLERLPEGLESGATAEKLQEVCSLDLDSLDVEEIESALDEAEAADLPQGFGRD